MRLERYQPVAWRQTVKKACAEVQEAKIAKVAFLSDDDQIRCGNE